MKLDQEVTVIAFDFFDTLASRDCNPEVVLYEWAREMSFNLGFSANPSDIYSLRKKAEKDGKNSGLEELPYDDLIGNLYDSLNNVEVSKEDFCIISKNTELAIEKKHITISRDNIEKVKKLSADHKIILISDFYLGSELFNIILEYYGIRDCFEKLYISEEHNARKSSGSLYKLVLNDLNISPGNLLMIGDNRHSDYEIPKSLGIQVRPAEANSKIEEKYSYKDIEKCYYRLLKGKNSDNPLRGYVPEVLYFISSLYSKLVRDEVKTALFCSREGQLLKKLFDKYQQTLYPEHQFKTIYFYVSRRATFLPSLMEFSKENFHILFRQFHKLKLSDFFNSIGFSSDETKSILQACNLMEDDWISDRQDDSVKLKLNSCQRFISMYDEKRLYQKRLFLRYLSSCGVNLDGDTISLVDIGWKGSIQDNIERIIPNTIKIKGYYFGLKFDEFGGENKKDKTGILFFDYPEKCKNFDLLNRDYMFWERIFVADHGPVCGYKEENSSILPDIDNSEEQLRIYQYMRPFQAKLIDSFVDTLCLFKYSAYLPYELYDLMVECALRKKCFYFPRIWKVEKTARSLSRENFGDVSKNQVERKEKFGTEQKKKKDFFYVDYTYRLLERYHLKVLYPMAGLYCEIVYLIKKRSVEK